MVSAADVLFTATIQNSSPPMRATMSVVRKCLVIACAIRGAGYEIKMRGQLPPHSENPYLFMIAAPVQPAVHNLRLQRKVKVYFLAEKILYLVHPGLGTGAVQGAIFRADGFKFA